MMNKLIISLLFILYSGQIRSQDSVPECNTDQPYKSVVNEMNIDIKEVDSTWYVSNKDRFSAKGFYKFKRLKNSDSIEQVLVKKHPKIFNKNGSKFIFKNYKGDDIVVENKNSKEDFKLFLSYQIIGIFNNHVIINELGYESWNSVMVNLNDGTAYSLADEPIFIKPNLIYAHTPYYGDFDITIIDLDKKTDLSMSFFNTDGIDVLHKGYHESGSILLKLNTRCKEIRKDKYLLIKI